MSEWWMMHQDPNYKEEMMDTSSVVDKIIEN